MFLAENKFQIKAFLGLLFVCFALEWLLVQFKVGEMFLLNPTEDKLEERVISAPSKVVIGLVSCQKAKQSRPESIFYRPGINEEALVTIKSILISAKVNNISNVDFHVFHEKPSDPAWFHQGFTSKQWQENVGVNVSFYFHSAIDAVPQKYRHHMIYHLQYRCGFVRMFISEVLTNVDSIIYLDTDMIVTGNIGELWSHFDKMSSSQLIGVARNNEPENHFVDHLPGFGDLALHPSAPKGLNSGLLLMNLTKMREANWTSRFSRLWEDYSKILPNLEDQRSLNMFTYLDPGQLYVVPCQFDIMHTNCDWGWICKAAEADPKGIQVVHGAGNQFQGEGRFKSLYKAYRDFKWSTKESILGQFTRKIAKPVRKSYKLKRNVTSKCYGTLDKLLFKSYIKK